MTQKRNPNDQVGAPVDSTAENSGDGGESRADHAATPKRRWRLSRRGFLIGLGAAGRAWQWAPTLENLLSIYSWRRAWRAVNTPGTVHATAGRSTALAGGVAG